MATFDSKTIVMMAENGHSVEIDGKKIQMTIVQEAQASEAKPDYSHLVGKWVKRTDYDNHNDEFTIGKYYPVVGDLNVAGALIDDHGDRNGNVVRNHLWFDLSNPLDHNPDEVRVFDVPSEIKIVGGAYGLGLCFSENQTLFYDVNSHCYAVLLKHGYSLLTCIATECKFDDLQEGDLFFATSDKKPDFGMLSEYNFLNHNSDFIWIDGKDIHVSSGFTYLNYFKITPKP